MCGCCVYQALGPAAEKDLCLVVWVDWMKCGVVSAAELNTTMDLVKKVLDARPTRSCCFMIAPQSSSERRSGMRAEWRLATQTGCFAQGLKIQKASGH